MTKLKTLFLFLFVYTCSLHYGQEIPFKNYTVKAGYNLPSNEFYDIVQDNKGYIWLGTIAGLVKFDGYNFTTYTTRDGLVDNSISALLVDKEGTLWVGTDNGGISVSNGNGFFNLTTNDGLISNNISHLFSDNKSNIWALAYDGGLSIIGKNSIRTFDKHNSILENVITCYLVDSSGKVFLANADGLYCFDSVFKKIDTSLMEHCVYVWDMAMDDNGSIWLASEMNGVFCFTEDTVLNFTIKNGLSSNTALSILCASDGKKYIGTYDGGINVIHNNKVVQVYNNSNSTLEIWKLFEDSRGRIWGNTKGNGLIQLLKSEVKYITKSNLLVDNNVTKVFEDDNNNIWFTTLNGLSKLGKTVFENFSTGFPGIDKKVHSIYGDENGTIYAGTYSGLNYFKPGDTLIKQIYINELPADPSVYSITGAPNNELWLGTNGGLSYAGKNFFYYLSDDSILKVSNDFITFSLAYANNKVYMATSIGLIVFSHGKYSLYTTDNGLIDNMLLSVALDNYGQIWCGTANGLSIFSKDTFYNYTITNGLSDNICNDIAFDSTGVAWIATEYGVTAAVLDKNNNLSTRNYTLTDGMGSNTLLSVLVDNHQQIWFGHNRGVDCLNPRTKKIRNYSNLEGFLPVENALGAITRDNNNCIWFGTIDGLVKYIPQNDIINTTSPKIYITRIELYNDSTSLEKYYSATDSITKLPLDLKLNWRKRNLVFHYVGIHYTVVEKNQYKYRLLGYDSDWLPLTNDIKSVPFQRIPPGYYTFQVMAANCDGIWNKYPAEFSFQILPPFWQTWWARILEIIIVLLSLSTIIYLRERKLINDKKILTQKVKERTLEIEKQKDQIAHQKQEITDSIEYAKHIQSAILPKDDTIAPLLREYFILYKPRDIVSGDFYWINSSNEKVTLIAADCTGHGVPGAFMSMLGVSTLNEIYNQQKQLTAGEILDTLRQHIIATLSHTKGGDEAKDGMDVALCIIDFNSMKAQYAGAYNPLVLIRDKEEIIYKADKMPVGLHSGEMQPFTNIDFDLQKNDCIYLFSDGYADQFGGPEGKKFKSANMRSLFCEICHLPAIDQKTILDKKINDWMIGYEQIDDIMVIGIKI